eukprot:TRINITY_DN7318_c0_g1_i2.p1 TRINITY_DN7318_c0_g1~~TRINITY_DN7318_c0_g1_i2.p1  ORF type:complete len:441 (-),score=122.07 TRINITY_DN7318_c0_g1_i2:137-1423(-)
MATDEPSGERSESDGETEGNGAALKRLLRRKEPGVFKQAAQVMSRQGKARRQTYYSWPHYVQETLWHPERESSAFDGGWRKLPLDQRLPLGRGLKTEGNNLFAEGKYTEAIDKYAQAAGLFHYIIRTGNAPDGGLDDEFLERISDDLPPTDAAADGAEEELAHAAAAARELRAACYGNIAQCCLRRNGEKDRAEALAACDEVTFRRALAREAIGGKENLQAAKQDLDAASRLAPDDPAPKQALRRVVAELQRSQKAERKMATGIFGDSSARTSASTADDQLAVDVSDLEELLEKSCYLQQVHLAEGRLDEAAQMEAASDRLSARIEERLGRSADVMRPTPDLKREAELFGIDLNDPEARKRLDQMMWEVQQALDKPDGGPVAAKAAKSSGAWTLCRDWMFAGLLGLGFARLLFEVLQSGHAAPHAAEM